MDPQSYEIGWVPMDNKHSPEVRAEEIRKIYVNSEEQLLHNSPEVLGKGVDINIFVDADHAGNNVTRRSHTGIIIYCNFSPIILFSKNRILWKLQSSLLR